jgi:acylpyruvate hydrolase
MRLATIRTTGGLRAARLEGDELVLLEAHDVGELLSSYDLAAVKSERGPVISAEGVDYATLVPRPPHVFCVGLNYREHIREMGRDLPTFPTLFAKFSSCLIGAHDDIVLPSISEKVDWEIELGIVIGTQARRVPPERAMEAIAGFTVVNDISMRDWQSRTTEWLQGKTFDATTPVGPTLVTLDELDNPFDLEVRCEVDGEVVQLDRTSQLVFGPREIVSYCSQIVTLMPGDIIATGTTGGVGAGRTPPRFLLPGQMVRSTIEGVGECVNMTVAEPDDRSHD